MVSPSRCPPSQPERPGPTRREPRRAQRSYTTCRDTILQTRVRLAPHTGDGRRLFSRFSPDPPYLATRHGQAAHKQAGIRRYMIAPGQWGRERPSLPIGYGNLPKLTRPRPLMPSGSCSWPAATGALGHGCLRTTIDMQLETVPSRPRSGGLSHSRGMSSNAPYQTTRSLWSRLSPHREPQRAFYPGEHDGSPFGYRRRRHQCPPTAPRDLVMLGAGGNGRGGDGGSWLKKQAKQGTQRSLGVTTGKEAVWSIHRNTSEKVVQ